jgi:hypothetical protein
MPDNEGKVSAAHAKAAQAERGATSQGQEAGARTQSGPGTSAGTFADPPRGPAAPINPMMAAPQPGAAPQHVIVQAVPMAQSFAPPEPVWPYTGSSEIIEGGAYIRNAKLRGNKHYGGEIVDAHGNVLATFKPDQENTGNPDDGTKPEPPQP